MAERIRIVVAQHGPDGPAREAEVIARALRDGGMEVVYTGPLQSAEQIAQTVVQEDADALVLTIPPAADTIAVVRRVVDLLTEHEASDVVVFVGGATSEQDVSELEALGAVEIFPTGATTVDNVERVRRNVAPQGVG